MQRERIVSLLKYTVFSVMLLCLFFTAGCGTDKWSASDEQSGTNAENQAQDQAKEEEQDPVGLTIFQTKDIYGNDINQEIFSDSDLTLVNVWGTFCGPCLDEMPDLGELQNEYEPKGVNIVGIVVDVQNENLEIIDEQMELAKDIAEGTGADYTHLLMSVEILPVMHQFDAIPASFFVDSSGNIVSELYIGSRSKEDWVDIIETNIANQKK